MPYRVGDRVRFIGPTAMGSREFRLTIGMIGTVRSASEHRLAVEFAGFAAGHSCDCGLGRRGYFLEPHEVEIVTAAEPVNAEPAPSIAQPQSRLRLKVEIRRDTEYGNWLLTIENGPQPDEITGTMLKPYIPKEYHRFIPRKFQWERAERFMEYAIQGGMPPEVLVDAIRSCCIAIQKRNSQGSFSAEQGLSEDYLKLIDEITSEPPLIAIGDKLFSLTPRGVINGARGLEMLRKRVVSKAKESAARMLTQAQAESRTMISTAEAQVARGRMELEMERQRMKMDAATTLPEWVRAGRHTLWFTGATTYPWMIGIWISLKVDRFEMSYADGREGRIYHWEPIRLSSPARIMLWLPINPSTGEFKYGGTSHGCRVTQLATPVVRLPHITENGCCMELQGMPKAIKDNNDLQKVASIVDRGMKVVNLSSLLTGIATWHRDVVDQTPEPVRRFLNHDMSVADFIATSTDHVNVATEAREIFTVEGMDRTIEAQRAERARRATATPAAAEAAPEIVIDPIPEDEEAVETPTFRVRE